MKKESITSGLAWRALTRSGENRTGVSLLGVRRSSRDANCTDLESYLVKTCCVLEGAGFEEPEPILGTAIGEQVWSAESFLKRVVSSSRLSGPSRALTRYKRVDKVPCRGFAGLDLQRQLDFDRTLGVPSSWRCWQSYNGIPL